MATYKRIASDGKPIEVTDAPSGLSENSGIKNSIVQPVMARDLSRAGTGVFTAGAEIQSSVSYWLIDGIRDFGTWTVTATNGTKTATQDVLVDVITEYEITMAYRLYL